MLSDLTTSDSHRAIFVSRDADAGPSNPDEYRDAVALALAHARRGWPVFPCCPKTKRPCIKDNLNAATTDEEQILHWWQRFPDAMTGIACGRAGIVALDFDTYKDPTLHAMMCEQLLLYPELEGAPIVKTPSGGLHLYLRVPSGTTIPTTHSRFASNVDVQAASAYVVGAGSARADGAKYEVVDGSLDALPLVSNALVASLIKPAGKAPSAASTELSAALRKPRAITFDGALPTFIADEIRPRTRAERTPTVISAMFKIARFCRANFGNEGKRRYETLLAQLSELSPDLDNPSRSGSKVNPVKKELERSDIWNAVSKDRPWTPQDRDSCKANERDFDSYLKIAEHIQATIPLESCCFSKSYRQLGAILGQKNAMTATRLMDRLVKAGLVVQHHVGAKYQPKPTGNTWDRLETSEESRARGGVSALWGLVGKQQSVEEVRQLATMRKSYQARVQSGKALQ